MNIGIVALEELDESEDLDETELPAKLERAKPASAANANAPSQPAGQRDDLMTAAQRRLLFRIAAERGVAPDDVAKWLETHIGLKDIRTWSKTDASRLIERLKANGHAGAAL